MNLVWLLNYLLKLESCMLVEYKAYFVVDGMMTME
jgi:hypothetical protein